MSGWADSDGEAEVRGPFTVNMIPVRSVFLIDMPAGKPTIRRPHVKGVPGATSGPDEDHLPGGGEWRDV